MIFYYKFIKFFNPKNKKTHYKAGVRITEELYNEKNVVIIGLIVSKIKNQNSHMNSNIMLYNLSIFKIDFRL